MRQINIGVRLAGACLSAFLPLAAMAVAAAHLPPHESDLLRDPYAHWREPTLLPLPALRQGVRTIVYIEPMAIIVRFVSKEEWRALLGVDAEKYAGVTENLPGGHCRITLLAGSPILLTPSEGRARDTFARPRSGMLDGERSQDEGIIWPRHEYVHTFLGENLVHEVAHCVAGAWHWPWDVIMAPSSPSSGLVDLK